MLEEELDPGSFDLVVPSHADKRLFSLEKRSDLLFSKEHLQVIFDDPTMLQRFTTFLYTTRPESVPLLGYYLHAVKALKALKYSNSLVKSLKPLDGHEFSTDKATATGNDSLISKADAAFEALAQEDLPAYITHTWSQIVGVSMKRRVTGSMPAALRDLSEGLAEVFCLTDPLRHDNPIIFASEGRPHQFTCSDN